MTYNSHRETPCSHFGYCNHHRNISPRLKAISSASHVHTLFAFKQDIESERLKNIILFGLTEKSITSALAFLCLVSLRSTLVWRQRPAWTAERIFHPTGFEQDVCQVTDLTAAGCETAGQPCKALRFYSCVWKTYKRLLQIEKVNSS